MTRDRLVRLLAVLLLLCLSACPSPPKPLLVGYTPVTGEGSEALLGALGKQRTEIHTGRGIYRAELRSGISRRTVRQVIAFERPALLRIEFFASSLEQLASLTVIRDGLLEGIDLTENVAYRGFATMENSERIFGLPFEPDEIMLWIVGALPVWTVRPDVLENRGEGRFGIRVPLSSNRLLRAVIEPAKDGRRLVRSVEIRSKDDELRFSSELDYDESTIPHTIRFHLPGKDLYGTLTRESFQLNPALPSEKLFTVRIPESLPLKLLGSGESELDAH